MQKVTLGIKKGMTQIFDEQGSVVPVTIIDLSDVYLIEIFESNSGFVVKLGLGNKKKPTKSEIQKYKKLKKVPRRVVEFHLSNKDLFADYKPGDSIKPSIFKVGDFTQVTSKTKGKGFAGVIKRWGFHGGPRTHGQTDRERAPGSIGGGTDPGRVYRGKKMPGHMGTKTKTVVNLKVAGIDDKNNYLLIKGGIPGTRGSVVEIRESRLMASKNSAKKVK